MTLGDPDHAVARLVAEPDLTPEDDAAIRELLAAACPRRIHSRTSASWWGSRPDHRLLLLDDGRLAAHLALERRVIEVGSEDVVVAGVGAMAVTPALQRRGYGRRLTEALLAVLLRDVPVSFGLLHAAPEHAAFAERAGWTRVDATSRFRDPATGRGEVADGPTFILPAGLPAAAWPAGPIDLRGTPW